MTTPAGRITIVMYHYVRELARSRYPAIKALEVDDFRGQLDYCRKHHEIISMADLLASVREASPLPPHAALLTFDDGYIDHYETVLPILRASNTPASFFPPAKAVLHHAVLDVNKIHFILAVRTSQEGSLLEEIWSIVDDYRSAFDLKTQDQYCAFERFSRYDTFEVELIKRLLQVELPHAVREHIVSRLFAKYVTSDEQSFAADLYMSVDHIRSLLDSGMYVGSHGYQHAWLDRMNSSEQELEIDRSIDFLRTICGGIDEWVMCYPYGAYNAELVSLLRRRSCRVGLTTDVGVADISAHDPLMLPRLDTNDLPKRVGERVPKPLSTRAGLRIHPYPYGN